MRTKNDNSKWLIILLLIFDAGIFVFLCLPAISNTEIIGFKVQRDNRHFVVTAVYGGSPADVAGLRPGDLVTHEAGQELALKYEKYRSSVDLYISDRLALMGQSVVYGIERAGSSRTIEIKPHLMRLPDLVRLYGVRLILGVLLAVLVIIILVSRTNKHAASLVMVTFSFAILWLLADIPDGIIFSAPVLFDTRSALNVTKKVIEIVALQLTVAALVHVVLVFPKKHVLLKKYPQTLFVIYLGTLCLLGMGALLSEGGILHRLFSLHGPRLWINTLILVVTTIILSSNYRTLSSAVDRERIRWMVAAFVIFVSLHLLLWNLPILLLGYPLVPHYEWVLVPGILIPITMTMSMINHRLFGMRGLIRGRILLLDTLLEREKSYVITRDQRIEEYQTEIRQLKSALEDYEETDRVVSDDRVSSLEKRYPEISVIRSQRLLGVSPLWETVFEHAVLAAQGSAPSLIVGESGTGKTDVAWMIYRLCDRRGQPFKAISCAQFEHADPAFALGRLFGIGAGHGLPNVPREGRIGLLEECDTGTLFLDDVDRLPLSVQDLLLYPLEGKPFEPGIGSGPPRKVSVKFIFATNRDPNQLVEQGKMRGDVLARIRSRVDIPPLRERPEDIPILIDHFVKLVGAEIGHKISLVSPKSIDQLCRSSYARGNARELKAEIEKAVGKAKLENDTVLRAGYLSEREKLGHDVSAQIFMRDRIDHVTVDRNLAGEELIEVFRRHQFQISAAESELGYSHKSKTLSHHLRGICIDAMYKADWDIGMAAATLSGVDSSKTAGKLRSKMRRYSKTILENIAAGTTTKLYQNLPVAYHEAMNEAIRYFGKVDNNKS